MSNWNVSRLLWLAFCVGVPPLLMSSRALGAGNGFDLVVGSEGKGNGKFFEIKDITFDAHDTLYVLDGTYWDRKVKTQQDGNQLHQHVSHLQARHVRKQRDPLMRERRICGLREAREPLVVPRIKPVVSVMGSKKDMEVRIERPSRKLHEQ